MFRLNGLFWGLFLTFSYSIYGENTHIFEDPAFPNNSNFQTQVDYCHSDPNPLATPQLQSLRSRIDASFSPASMQTNASLGIPEIQQLFLSLDRSKIPAEEYLRAKYMMMHWRLATRKRIWTKLKSASADQRAEVFLQTLSDLNGLGLALSPKELRDLQNQYQTLKQQIAKPELNQQMGVAMAQLIANLGFKDIQFSRNILNQMGADSLINRLGPAAHTAIATVDKTPTTFSQWSKNPEFSRYQYETDANGRVIGIFFHGMNLRVGDAFLVNTHTDSGWVFSGFSNPKAIVSHAAILTILKSADGHPVPAIIEQAAQGARAVPVNDFMTEHSLKNNSYIEIVRPRFLPDPDGLNRAAQASLGKGKYDFNATYVVRDMSDTPRGNTCSGLVAQLMKAGGAPLPSHFSTVPLTAQRNLQRLGSNLSAYYTPNDILKSPMYFSVGTVDLGDFTKLVSTEAAMKEFGCLMTTRQIDPRKQELKTKMTARVLANAQRGRRIASRIIEGQGIPRQNIPMGSSKAAAASLEVGKDIATANDLLNSPGPLNLSQELVASINDPNPRAFDLNDFLSRSDVEAKSKKATQKLRGLFH